MEFKRSCQRLEQLRGRALVASTKPKGNCKFASVRQIHFRGQRDVAVLGSREFPVHLEMVHQVLPAIAEADVADRSPGETAAACHEQMDVLPLRMEQFVVAELRVPSGVTGAEASQVWREQSIQAQLAAQQF